jgi:hypothetical protein
MWGSAQNQLDEEPEDFAGLYSANVPNPVYAPAPEQDLNATRPFTPVTDPWSSSGGRLGADAESGKKFIPPGSDARQRAGGPPGWLLGLFGLLLILGVAGATAWFIGQPLIEDEIAEQTGAGIEQAVAEVTIAAPLQPGTVVVNEADINRVIRENSERFEPVRDIRVHVRRNGIEAQLSVFGVSTTLTGTLDVEDGRLVVVDPELSGVARRLVDLDDITPQIEQAVNDVFLRNGVEVTGVELADDTITLSTQPVTP